MPTTSRHKHTRFSIAASAWPAASADAGLCIRPLGLRFRPPSPARCRATLSGGAPPLPVAAVGAAPARGGAGRCSSGAVGSGVSLMAFGPSAESSGDIVIGAAVLGRREDLLRRADLHQLAQGHEGGDVRN